ncbi:hypothetical protein WJX73_005813 [Symbiochloris irregularis]|uniref:peptidylprolyl isomerase n=1 Tax=Symbiochloris irregularis TaxID=706552 RepID=A0AAW1PVH1_9CHLO
MGRNAVLLLCISALLLSVGEAKKKAKNVDKLQIGVKHKPSVCTLKSKSGDKLFIHYTGSLTDGTVFDSSVTRGTPFSFTLGQGMVIRGWDQGLQNMCVGEKRKLKIPADLGYGERGSPPKIPGGATLIFDTELISIGGGDIITDEF